MTGRLLRVLQVSVAAVVVLLPLGDRAVPVLGLRVAFVAMAVPTLLTVFALITDKVPVPPSLILTGLGLGVAGGVVSAAQGVAPQASIPVVVISVLCLGYATAIVYAFRPGLDVTALDLLVVVGGVISAMALLTAGAMHATDEGTVVSGRLTGVFSQPNELGIFCAALLPIAVATLVTTRSTRRRMVLGAAAVCIVGAWALSMSRGAWIGGAVALVCFAICEPTARHTIGSIGSGLVGICLVSVVLPSSTPLLGLVGARIGSLGDPTASPYDDRPLVWAEAWRQATLHPWLGVGPDGFESASTLSGSAVAASPPDHPHDLVLTALADRGVVGLAFGVLVVVGCFAAARGQMLRDPFVIGADEPSRIRCMSVLAALAAVLVHCTFDMPLRNPIVAALVWTLLGMAATVEIRGRARCRGRTDPHAPRTFQPTGTTCTP